MRGLFDGCMKGRTMYVVPYVMGPADSPFAKVGIELTDSVYVALNMGIMTRMGKVALDRLGDKNDFNKGLHAVAECDPEKRFICHFPQDNTIWSVGSGYGGNALLGKKCLALRIGSLPRQEGGLARRAHAHPRGREPGGRDQLRGGRLPVGLRQDQLRHAHPAQGVRRAGRSAPWATTSPGCASGATAGSGR